MGVHFIVLVLTFMYKPSTCRTECPSSIPNGTVSVGCSRAYGTWCFGYVCSNGCPGSIQDLYCDSQGDWLYADTACTCTKNPTTNAPNRCPSLIPNGRISNVCDRSPGSVCGFFCDYGCHSKKYSYSLKCSQYGYWYGENTACQCQDMPADKARDTDFIFMLSSVSILVTTFPKKLSEHTEESEDSHGLAIAIGCIVGILVIGTIVTVCGCYSRRTPKSSAGVIIELGNLGQNNGRTYSATTTQSAPSSSVLPDTVSTISTVQGNINSPSQASERNTHTEDPPMYSTLFPSDPGPSPVLPSYEECAAHL